MMNANEAIALVQEKLLTWLKGIITLLPNLLMAAVVVTLGWFVARVVRVLVGKLVGRFTDSNTLRRLLGNIAYIFVISVGAFVALSVMHLDKTVTSILAGAGILGLALSFAFQDMAANFISGVVMASQRPIKVGELIETGETLGVVQRIDIRTTEIMDLHGIQVIIPNKDIFQTVLKNYTRYGSRRVDLMVGISYGEDLERVERITLEAVQQVEGLLPDHEVEFYYREFGDSSINFEVRYWIKAESQKHYNECLSRGVKAIKAAYNANDIMIPFPIRTLDFGIKGGEKLNAMLSDRAGRA